MISTSDNAVVRLGRGLALIKKTYTVEDSPFGIIFDGTSVWVANYNSATVSKITRTGALSVAPRRNASGPLCMSRAASPAKLLTLAIWFG